MLQGLPAIPVFQGAGGDKQEQANKEQGKSDIQRLETDATYLLHNK
jgi:hypothetical protein